MTTPNNPHGNNCICDTCVPREDDGYTAYLDELLVVERANGIKRTSWSLGMDFPVAKLTEKHPFVGVKWVTDGHCPSLTKIKGDTWLDIWKACERMKFKRNDYHNFIEIITQKGNVLEIFCGS